MQGSSALKDALDPLPSTTIAGERIWYFSIGKGSIQYVMGNRARLDETLVSPFWDRESARTIFQVDHILEWQLGGEDDSENLWLLERSANASVGSRSTVVSRR